MLVAFFSLFSSACESVPFFPPSWAKAKRTSEVVDCIEGNNIRKKRALKLLCVFRKNVVKKYYSV